MKTFFGFLAALIVGIAVVLTALFFVVDPNNFGGLVGVAPIITATIALFAATTALTALYIQRDTAQRRAAVDFFLKIEADDNLIGAYADYERLVQELPRIIATPNLSYSNPDYRAMRKWLNLCELIATGVKLEAFSYKVTYAYWGYILLDTYRYGLPLIQHIRTSSSLGGGPNSFCDLQWLAEKFAPGDDRSASAA